MIDIAQKDKLPKGWKWVKLKEICNFEYGSSLPQRDRSEGGFPVYGSNGIVGYHNEAITKDTTIIIGRKGSVGEVHFSKIPCFPIDTTYYIETTKIPMDLYWLYYLLKNLNLSELNKAAAIPGLNRNDALNMHVPLPPLPEQKRIAAILNQQLAAVEKARQAAQQQLEAAKALPNAYLREVFESEESKKWKKFILKDVCIKITDGTHHSPPNGHEGIPYITAKNIRQFEMNLSNLTYVTKEDHQRIYSRCNPVKGDVLYIKDGATMGIATINSLDYEFSMLSSVALLKSNPGLLNSGYLAIWLNSPFTYLKVLEDQSGSAIKRMVLSYIENMIIPLPDMKMQIDIAETFFDKYALYKKVIFALEHQLRELNTIPASLLRKAFLGSL